MTHPDLTSSDPVEDTASTESYHVSYQWDRNQSLITTLVYAIADSSNKHPCDIPPLGATVDVEALEELLDHLSDKNHSNTSYTTFPVEDWLVTVYGTGKIVISDSD
ncbi:HalOD1 output domain-containing protein [Halalkalicoccus salilacus]|uniref:HalOD1 output domain-containing protein n=1 Tax=Halalkalicoccus TaxID=332246 RepID=UPI003606E551